MNCTNHQDSPMVHKYQRSGTGAVSLFFCSQLRSPISSLAPLSQMKHFNPAAFFFYFANTLHLTIRDSVHNSKAQNKQLAEGTIGGKNRQVTEFSH